MTKRTSAFSNTYGILTPMCDVVQLTISQSQTSLLVHCVKFNEAKHRISRTTDVSPAQAFARADANLIETYQPPYSSCAHRVRALARLLSGPA